MEYRKMGNTGLKLSELSLGSWLTFGNQITDDVAERLMQIAYDQGVNFFDNAEVYAHGKSEIVMGNIFKKVAWSRDSYIVSSKVYFGTGGKWPTQRGLSRKHVVEACHQALHRLQLDYLDLYLCHRPDADTPMEELVWTMTNLIQQGKILYWGTSEWNAQEIMEAHMVAKQNNLIGPSVEQPQYNMFHRQTMELEHQGVFKNIGLGTTIWSPLASGVLSGKYLDTDPKDTRLGMEGMEWLVNLTYSQERLDKTRALKPIADALGISLAVMAVAWCLKNPNVTTVILGASKTHQLEENFKAIEAKHLLTEEVMQQIEEVLQNKPVRYQF